MSHWRITRLRALVPQPWTLATLATALLLMLPVITVVSFVFQPAGEVWRHLARTVLAGYIINSLALMLGVAFGTVVIGVSTAWLVTLCRFPGRKTFEWILLLPLAVPAYIIAYTYTGMLDFAGPVQTALRTWFGWQSGDYWFPRIRSLGGAICMLSLVLYPYVYLLARAAFLEQSVRAIDVSRALGCGAWTSFFRVSLPAARPAIVAGLSLALMETLADYGTVQYFGVSTFTTGIFRTWFGLGDSAAAAQLAAVMMLFVFALIVIEQRSRRRARYYHIESRARPLPSYTLGGMRAATAFTVCLLPFTLGFLLPAGQLLWWSVQTAPATMDRSFVRLVVNTLLLAGSAAMLAVLVSLLMAYGRRLSDSLGAAFAVRLAGMGYAVPGVVIAVGVMLPFTWLDNTIDAWARARFGVSTGLLLSGTLFMLMFAYMVRFLAVALQTVEAGLGKITRSMDEAARSFGYRPLTVIGQVHIPIMRASLLTAIILVFVDVMKELPATLILRPFDFNTLAVRTYELASDERLADASTAALAIVLVGIIPVLLLSRSIARSRRSEIGPAQLRESLAVAP